MASVILDHVCKKYPNSQYAVKDFNLSIKHGEFVVFVGPSGCGKSTTLNMICGLDDPTEGTISIGDRIVNQVPPKNRDIAMVFQNYALYPHMTVEANMGFALKLRGFSRADIRKRVHETAAMLGLENLLHRLPKELSGGQRQRVAVGRAIVRNSSVYLFDEPLSNLDAKLRVQMRVEIHELHKRLGATMIYVTHDQVEAMTLGDRIVVMKDGEVQQVDTPMNLYANPANRFVASFLGTPPMNFIEGTLFRGERGFGFKQDGGAGIWPLGYRFAPVLGTLDKRNVTLGIRPENIGSLRAQSHPESLRIKGRVRVVEKLGAESLVHLDVGEGSAVIARFDEPCGTPEGEMIEVPMLEDRICFFDSHSGHSIPH